MLLFLFVGELSHLMNMNIANILFDCLIDLTLLPLSTGTDTIKCSLGSWLMYICEVVYIYIYSTKLSVCWSGSLLPLSSSLISDYSREQIHYRYVLYMTPLQKNASYPFKLKKKKHAYFNPN